MSKRLYIGGLTYHTTEGELEALFSEIGGYTSIRIITDRETGRSKGFGFVEMTTDDGALAAIQRFDGTMLDGRRLTVNEARPQEPRAASGSGGFGGPRRANFGPRESFGSGGGGRRY